MDTNSQNEQKETSTTTPVNSTGTNIENDTLMSILSYLGPLVIIPYLTSLNDEFVKFHVKQGLVLFGFELGFYILGSFFFLGMGIYPIISILNLGLLILTIIGIVNVVQKKKEKLPLVGNLADKINI